MFLFGSCCCCCSSRRCRRLHRRGDRRFSRNVDRRLCEVHNDVIRSALSRNRIAITMQYTEIENSMDSKPQIDTKKVTKLSFAYGMDCNFNGSTFCAALYWTYIIVFNHSSIRSIRVENR